MNFTIRDNYRKLRAVSITLFLLAIVLTPYLPTSTADKLFRYTFLSITVFAAIVNFVLIEHRSTSKLYHEGLDYHSFIKNPLGKSNQAYSAWLLVYSYALLITILGPFAVNILLHFPQDPAFKVTIMTLFSGSVIRSALLYHSRMSIIFGMLDKLVQVDCKHIVDYISQIIWHFVNIAFYVWALAQIFGLQ